MVEVEQKSWSNEQYSRRESLEIVGIPETVINSSLEETTLHIFKELDISIDTSDIEVCHRVGLPCWKKLIMKMFRRKDGNSAAGKKHTLRLWSWSH